jgi:hypothetical protein
VKEVWVAGECVVEGGRVTTVDEGEVVKLSRPLAQRLARRAGLESLSRLAR